MWLKFGIWYLGVNVGMCMLWVNVLVVEIVIKWNFDGINIMN